MTIELATRTTTSDERAPSGALTSTGAACAALLAFEELYRALPMADRAYFAGEQADLAREAATDR